MYYEFWSVSSGNLLLVGNSLHECLDFIRKLVKYGLYDTLRNGSKAQWGLVEFATSKPTRWTELHKVWSEDVLRIWAIQGVAPPRQLSLP